MASTLDHGRDWKDPAQPELLRCDVIFRGGITSGVVYPGTVAALSEKYRFVNIGGASAGAIAAGITAAAEYGWAANAEKDAKRSPFRRLAEIGRQVGGSDPNGTSLKTMFRPADRLKPLFDPLWRLMEAKQSGWAFWPALRLLATIFRHFGLQLLLGLAVTVGLFLIAPLGEGFLVRVAVAAAFVLVGLVLAIVAITWHVVVMVRRHLPANGFGLCPGINPDAAQNKDSLLKTGGLMDWMHATIQDLAGRHVCEVAKHVASGAIPASVPANDRPLCMVDLWGPDGVRRNIDLVLTTTNLSQQLAHQFPFLAKAQTPLFFKPEDLKKVLPDDVVQWMILARGISRVPDHVQIPPEYIPLPEPENLPVLLGVRMSLSFPVLISAVKLYAPDTQDNWTMRPCWFSDGGITSNFPLSLFDAPLPTWPTFCINLRPANEAEENAQQPGVGAAASAADNAQPGVTEARSPDPLVDMPLANSDDISARFGAELEKKGVLGFAAAIVATARNGYENELMLMPGYRDRIVHVVTRKAEGGLNLSMPASTIEALSARGEVAANMLISRFHPEGAAAKAGFLMGWGNQRWIRYRSVASALEYFLAQFRATWEEKAPLGHAYRDMLRNADPDNPANNAPTNPGDRYTPSYKWQSAAIAGAAVKVTESVATLSALMQDEAAQHNQGLSLLDGSAARKGRSPRPRMMLQLRSAGGDPRRKADVVYGRKPPA